ncbi:hypothetical protein [Cytobacillus oceanisediminis]|uniref:hypothetical protein n=1 Tax=Cytobacillus oceanisediminis TaxID=665099 RepID=UPI001FB1F23D|nr:hypothetical protein [Cytobacillus oceanisediminis]UOE58203.1 hypothetical protein IRB79_27260 [Cytobacillus oceanisediminis]
MYIHKVASLFNSEKIYHMCFDIDSGHRQAKQLKESLLVLISNSVDLSIKSSSNAAFNAAFDYIKYDLEGKVPIRNIVITRGEGPSVETGIPYTVSNWDEGNLVLRSMAKTAPDCGGYDKTDFVITFEDDETYIGTYDLKRKDMHEADLKGHVLSHVGYYAGIQKPPWMKQEAYHKDLASFEPGMKEEAREYLSKYLSN